MRELLARWKLNFTSSAVNGSAVVELEPLAQLELIGPLIRTERPRLGQARRHDVAGHRLDQGIVERVLDPERRDKAQHLARIEPGRRHRHVERPAHLALGLGLGFRPADEPARQEGAERDADEHPQAGWAERALTAHAGSPMIDPAPAMIAERADSV